MQTKNCARAIQFKYAWFTPLEHELENSVFTSHGHSCDSIHYSIKKSQINKTDLSPLCRLEWTFYKLVVVIRSLLKVLYCSVEMSQENFWQQKDIELYFDKSVWWLFFFSMWLFFLCANCKLGLLNKLGYLYQESKEGFFSWNRYTCIYRN